MQGHPITDPAAVREFITAGNATLTLRSAKTGTRYTFRTRKIEDADNRFFVSLMTGPDNEQSFSYLGLMQSNATHTGFRTTAKSKLAPDSTPVRAFKFLCERVTERDLPETLEVWHEGRCGRCNRKLTTPENLERGIGPECATRMRA